MTKVKICGLKEKVHVHCAVAAGANFLGFVFAPSKRQISIRKACELSQIVPKHVKKVGVFVNPTEDEVKEAFEKVPLDFIQYHGNEEPTFIEKLGLPSIKAFSIRELSDVEKASKYNVDYYLFDAPGTDFAGGSGKAFDWSLLDQLSIPKEKVILAGGLNALNVQQAIAAVHPFAVDVSSGVEQDGKKNCELIQSFIQAATTLQ
ncbi:MULTISPECIES: phosphoribosylanthranilate isomerase [Ureibacillus]|jgi:phosphoribosylanthranilate isomerase|uniref:N-(5'-phosphoribosyl)anthranilate isomerase n=1 Tax=Ureibacillus thermosphaericus TaxID=51173 RepID=A0A840PVZ7_URETH|nr:phosphoribosylanthranilate isomerase [Ureibacillus thermosphaericus]MBB5150093.1 phosphoribosylanthranilate isomerase [Ureibacillus thermosphaericus]NKZ30584.1 phosphoribosylanthranilate isomerase [Ureibacillus thermosphaericus]